MVGHELYLGLGEALHRIQAIEALTRTTFAEIAQNSIALNSLKERVEQGQQEDLASRVAHLEAAFTASAEREAALAARAERAEGLAASLAAKVADLERKMEQIRKVVQILIGQVNRSRIAISRSRDTVLDTVDDWLDAEKGRVLDIVYEALDAELVTVREALDAERNRAVDRNSALVRNVVLALADAGSLPTVRTPPEAPKVNGNRKRRARFSVADPGGGSPARDEGARASAPATEEWVDVSESEAAGLYKLDDRPLLEVLRDFYPAETQGRPVVTMPDGSEVHVAIKLGKRELVVRTVEYNKNFLIAGISCGDCHSYDARTATEFTVRGLCRRQQDKKRLRGGRDGRPRASGGAVERVEVGPQDVDPPATPVPPPCGDAAAGGDGDGGERTIAGWAPTAGKLTAHPLDGP